MFELGLDLKQIYQEIKAFSEEPHPQYQKETIFVKGKGPFLFAPLKVLIKKIDGLTSDRDLCRQGLVCDAHHLHGEEFALWFERQFKKKMTGTFAKKIGIFYFPDNKSIFDSIELVNKGYKVLYDQHIIINNKNLPVQLGEWYAKVIFGLWQLRSTSQRGFDFFLNEQKVEVKVEWGDSSSLKGVKIRKTLLEQSHICILMYINRTFKIRDICFLDSDFVMRKFSGKGHTIFLKDADIAPYFFSNSTKHIDKVIHSSTLMKYATPQFALSLSEVFS